MRRLVVVLFVTTTISFASCGTPRDDSGDAWTEVPVVILPDPGSPDPQTQPDLLLDYGSDPGTKDPLPPDPGRDSAWQDAPDVPPGPEDPGVPDLGLSDSAPPDPACVRNCTNRQCGSDGCGGSCGDCTPPAICLSFQCVCTPRCDGRTCGDDGCGGLCPPGCPDDRPCSPEGKCMGTGVPGACPRSTTVECDASYSPIGGTGATSANSDLLDLYPAECDNAIAHGPERVFRMVPDTSGTITVTFEQSSPVGQRFLQVFVLEGKDCLTTSCIGTGQGTFDVAVKAGQTYWFVVDALVNNTGTFRISLDCDWYTPPVDY